MIVIAGLLTVIMLSWIYILMGAGLDMQDQGGGSLLSGGSMGGAVEMPMEAIMTPAAWTPSYAVLLFFMWWVMMVAMMLPGAAPMLLLYALINRKQRERGAPFVPTGVFASGYIVVWGSFSLLAVGLQWGLERAALLSSTIAGTTAAFGGILLIAAGAYQLTPLKHACLRHCRGPLQFITRHWRKGTFGAFRMGLVHGAFCFGCCWVLMGLLFVGGVMNLYWIAGLAIFVLLEKTIPAGHRLGSLAGLGLIAWGGMVFVTAA